jgi:adenosylhomocysteinase
MKFQSKIFMIFSLAIQAYAIDFEVLEESHTYCPLERFPLIKEQMEEFSSSKPYEGLKIFHNIPLTMCTVLKVETLLKAGADVTVSAINAVPADPKAIDILRRAGVCLDLEKKLDKEYDIYLDCCAELVNVKPPKLGTIELTQTGTRIYNKAALKYPVISVDDSHLKNLETIGTGYGCVNALKELLKRDLLDEKFVVFGYGKVGQGIVNALKKSTKNITVIDLKRIERVNSLAIEEHDAILALLKEAFCVITATGKMGCISAYFEKEDLEGAILANMGAEDEFGPKFSPEDVLCNKHPINFSISEPTPLEYLDPIFFAHNKAIDFLISKKASNGYQPLDKDFASFVIEKWQRIHSLNR